MYDVIVSGSSSGIGKAVADELKKEYNIIKVSRRDGVDLRDIKKIDGIVADDVYAIINNAGICPKKRFYDYSLEDWNRIVDTNIRPVWYLASKFLDDLKKNHGCIINISSVHAVATLDKNSVYAMTKGAIESFSRGMALELAEYGIRVNCVRPGSVLTPMLRYERDMEKTIPMQRVAEPEEVAKIVRFLLGRDSSYITGECITIDGGVLSKLSVMK